MDSNPENVDQALRLIRKYDNRSGQTSPASPQQGQTAQQAAPSPQPVPQQPSQPQSVPASPPMQARPQGARPVPQTNVGAGMLITEGSSSAAALPMTTSGQEERRDLSDRTKRALELTRSVFQDIEEARKETEIPRYLDRRQVQQNAILNIANGVFLDVPENVLPRPRISGRLTQEGEEISLRELSGIASQGDAVRGSEQREIGNYVQKRARMRAQNLSDMLAVALQVPRDNVDVSSGLGNAPLRARMGALESFDEKIALLRENYGQDNVKFLSVNGRPAPLVKRNGKWVLVDEYGASFGDVLDVSRQAITATGEVAAAYGVGKTGFLRALPVTRAALAASAGNLVAGSSLNLFAGGEKTEGKLLRSIVEASPEALTAGVVDFTAGSSFKLGAKTILPYISRRMSQSDDEFFNSLRDLEQKFGVNLTGRTTSGMRASLRAAEQEATLEPYNSTGRLAMRREAFRSVLRDITSRLQGGSDDIGWPSISESYQQNIRRIAREDAAAIAEGDEAARQFLLRSVDQRLSNLGERGRSPAETGSEARGILRDIDESTQRQVDELYEEAFAVADEYNVTMSFSEFEKRIEGVINSLDLPSDLEKRVFDAFLPRSARRIRAQAGAASKAQKEAAEGAPTLLDQYGNPIDVSAVREGAQQEYLTFRQLVDLKKEYGRAYGALLNSGVEKRALQKILREFDSVLSDSARQAGSNAKALVDNANATWLRIREPILSDNNFQKAIGTRANRQEYVTDDSQVLQLLFGRSRDRINRYNRLRELSGNPRLFDEKMREAYLSHFVWGARDQNGEISMAAISRMRRDREMTEKIFGTSGYSALGLIEEIGKAAADPSSISISAPLIRRAARASTAEERRQVSQAVRKYIMAKRRQAQLTSNHIIESINDSVDIQLDINTIMTGVDRLNPSQLRQMMDLLPDDAARQSFRQSYYGKIFNEARVFDPEDAHRNTLWDPDKMDKILKSPERVDAIRAVLGKDGLKNIRQLNTVMRRGKKLEVANQGDLFRFFSPQIVTSPRREGGVGMMAYNSVPGKDILLKGLSIAAASETFSSIIFRSQTVDELMTRAMPAIIGTTAGIEGASYEANKDPRFRLFIRDLADLTREEAVRTAKRGEVEIAQ